MQIEPPDGHLQNDGDMVKADAEVVCQVAEENQVQVLDEHPGSLWTPFHQNLHYESIILSLWPPRKFGAFSSSFSFIHFLESGSSRIPTTLFSFSVLQHQSHQHAAMKCPCPLCVSMPTKKHERKSNAVVIYQRRYRACRR